MNPDNFEQKFKTHCLQYGDANNKARYTYVLTISEMLYNRVGKPIIVLPNGYLTESSMLLDSYERTQHYAYRLCYDRPISSAATYEFNTAYQRLYSTNKPSDLMALHKVFPEVVSLGVPMCR